MCDPSSLSCAPGSECYIACLLAFRASTCWFPGKVQTGSRLQLTRLLCLAMLPRYTMQGYDQDADEKCASLMYLQGKQTQQRPQAALAPQPLRSIAWIPRHLLLLPTHLTWAR